MTMLPQISLRLDYIHTYNPPIIYRDIKPSNILHCRGKYLLGDFGIAKTVDNSHILVGTNSYRAPELWQGDDQTTSLDIYGLGATIIEALGGFPDLANRPATWQLWHHHL
jgi:serine/threonine protein kinase